VLVASGLLPACLTMKSGGEPSALMKVTGAEVSAAQLRALGNELAIRIPALIERSGDQMLLRTEDPLLRKHALLWKIEGTAAFHQALFRPDALGAGIETYALAVQLEDWVSGPAGKLTDAIATEREAVLGNIDRQRLATLADLDRKIDRALQDVDGIRAHAMTDVEGIITRTLWRVLLAIAVLMLLGAVLRLLLLRTRRAPGPADLE
jgi:hypothetical protein